MGLVVIYKVGDIAIFDHPNRDRAKIDFRGEDMIVEDIISSHTLRLKASPENRFRLPSYRVIAHVQQVKKKYLSLENPISPLPPKSSNTKTYSSNSNASELQPNDALIKPVINAFIQLYCV